MASSIKTVRFAEDVKSYDGKKPLTLYFEKVCCRLSHPTVVINDICQDVPFEYWVDIFGLLCSLLSRIENGSINRFTPIMMDGGSSVRIPRILYKIYLFRIPKLCLHLFNTIPDKTQ